MAPESVLETRGLRKEFRTRGGRRVIGVRDLCCWQQCSSHRGLISAAEIYLDPYHRH